MDLPNTAVNRVYIYQLTKSSSSVGANYRAAQKAKSDADFINKLKIVEEEADKSVYFLDLPAEFNPTFLYRITNLSKEVTKILKIIVASINTTRARVSKR